MAIISIKFNKINAENKGVPKGKINISNKISIKDVKEKVIAPGKSEQKGLEFSFAFESKYEPKVGVINLGGIVFAILPKKATEDILTSWKKNKKVPKEVETGVLNAALTRCNIEALLISQRIAIPPPIPLPKLRAKK